jgi:hypothetical protein
MCDFHVQELSNERKKEEIHHGKQIIAFFTTTLVLFVISFISSALKYADADFYVGLLT